MKNKIRKIFLISLLLVGVLLAARLVLAADFGVNEVNNGLAGSLGSDDPRTIAGRIINIALGFLGAIAIGLIIYAGFLWMTSNGNEEKVETAKKILKNAAIGLVIILASWAIATFIISRLGGAINGGNNGDDCLSGSVSSCECGGTMYCSDGVWGACIGSDCNNIDEPSSCDSDVLTPACDALNQICSPSDYCDENDCGCKPRGNQGDPCDVDLSNATCDPSNNRCSQYLTCNPENCICFGPPVITGISPLGGFCQNNFNQSCQTDSDCSGTCDLLTPNGAVNNFVTIFGKSFGEYSATSSQVIFMGSGDEKVGRSPVELNPTCVSFWSDSQIIIAVPVGVSTGPIKVTASSLLEDTTNNNYGPQLPNFQANNISRPGLCYLSPQRGLLSSEVGYQGINLYSGEAYFGNYQTSVRGLSSNFNSPAGLNGTSTTPNIRSGESGSFVQKTDGNQERSNYLTFVKEREPGEGPFISSFIPTAGNAGQYVTIRGRGFGSTRGESSVWFGDQEAIYEFPDVCLNSIWKDNQIIVKVPAGMSDGYQLIKVRLGASTIDTQKLNPNTFQTNKNLSLKSSLCKIEPQRGLAETPVVVWGEYFGRVNSEGLVRFNYNKDTSGEIKNEGRADKIATIVPVGATTGAVKVIKNSDWGNELNFSIGECVVNADCGTQVCCPQNTYKQGRCVNSLDNCFIDIPTSVFEWKFSTDFGGSTSTPYSCAGLAKYYGSCQTGKSCPNVPGSCSPYAGGGQKIVGDCDYSCLSVPGCGGLGLNNCTYDVNLDKCIKNGDGANCSLAQNFSYIFNDQTISAVKTCNPDGRWELSSPSSCPNGWIRAAGNKCLEIGTTCELCSPEFKCESIANEGRCASKKICPSGSTCTDNPILSEKDSCTITDKATCDCCCEIGQSARDCCAPLECEGTCGADTGKTVGVTLGKCGGCKSAGATLEARDAACNCSGHSGQYCDINNPEFPDGVCTDCSDLSGQTCTEHNNVCCLDSHSTVEATDDICRGGNGQLITNQPSSPDFGYCAYYRCSITEPSQCASSTPVKLGDYLTVEKCNQSCADLEDPCSAYETIGDCQKNSRCCFDAKGSDGKKCRLGTAITAGVDSGYCAYYNCTAEEPITCASSTPAKLGVYDKLDSCLRSCPTIPKPGLSCAGKATSTCATNICNFPGFDCLSPEGTLGVEASDCGTCCCSPNATIDTCSSIDPKLECLKDKGNCSGDNRGLCCGCSKDEECGAPASIGCGTDTCCQNRPEITSTSPTHLADNICRNSVAKATFNQLMDITSLTDNILLLEERDYSQGTCPTGTFIAKGDSMAELLAQSDQTWFNRVVEKIKLSFAQISKRLTGSALADVPGPNKLYCATPGIVSGENAGDKTTVVFAPKKLLAPNANYYLVVLGDVQLNSQLGVLSLTGIGFNGVGYLDPITGRNIEGENIKFNSRNYPNSHIIKFTTLSAQGPLAGICAIDKVTIVPSSYLFRTSDNDLDEDDGNVNSKTFDTKADRDKLFTARAYSVDGQSLQPVTGYFWDWEFSISDTKIAVRTPVNNLETYRALITAQTGVTDGETSAKAIVKMDRFITGCQPGSCSCLDASCSNNCCNVYSGGDGFNAFANLYVFLCNNPWPPISSDGNWSPWADSCVGSITPNCADYNYKFYYCRDAGTAGTLDDLPAIINQAVIRGQSANLMCSSDREPCTNLGSLCGRDQNGDGQKDGICSWNVLKESYFFREVIPASGEITEAIDQKTGGTVLVEWRANANQAEFYKIYYLKAGKGNVQTKEVKASDACQIIGSIHQCRLLIGELTNNIAYIFNVSVISANRTESSLSNEKTATPTDQIAPATPRDLSASQSASSTLTFTWIANLSDTAFYRLYHGIAAGRYGESFDSEKQATELSFALDEFVSGKNYFTLSALDASGNESAKSLEISVDIP